MKVRLRASDFGIVVYTGDSHLRLVATWKTHFHAVVAKLPKAR